MKITYELEPLERKTLVKAIALQAELKAVYLGMPSAAYQIGGWYIDKAGTVTGPDNRELIATLRDRHSFVPTSEEYDTPTADANPEADPACPQPDRLTIEVPIDDNFTPAKMANLEKLVASRETLLKKVLGTDVLPIEQIDGVLRFPWFTVDDNAMVYNQLASALVRVATEATRITAREQQDCVSDKFRMRTYLLKLGFIGDEYKQARKILTRGLSGSGSYAKADPNKTTETNHADNHISGDFL